MKERPSIATRLYSLFEFVPILGLSEILKLIKLFINNQFEFFYFRSFRCFVYINAYYAIRYLNPSKMLGVIKVQNILTLV
jgi:hypothetical protein